MKIKVKELSELSDDQKSHFVEHQINGEKVYVHKDYLESLKEAEALKAKVEEMETSGADMKAKLDELIKAEEEREEQRKKEELDDKKKNGQFDEIISDWEKKYNDKEQEISNLKSQMRDEQKQTIVQRLAASGTEEGRERLARLINQDLSYADDGKLIVLDAQGKATSTTLEQYESNLSTAYPEYIKATGSSGGSGTGGYNSGSGEKKQMSRKEFDTMQHAERAAFFKDGGKLIED